MSDQIPADKDTVPYVDLFNLITDEDYIAFMGEKNIKIDCELCGSSEWICDEIENDQIPIIPIHLKNSGSQFKSLSPLSYIFCENCGNTRIFNRPTILRWKRDKAKGSQNG